jgi:hypothetical protein
MSAEWVTAVATVFTALVIAASALPRYCRFEVMESGEFGAAPAFVRTISNHFDAVGAGAR